PQDGLGEADRAAVPGREVDLAFHPSIPPRNVSGGAPDPRAPAPARSSRPGRADRPGATRAGRPGRARPGRTRRIRPGARRAAGSVSTYTTRASGWRACAISCTLPTVGIPEPRSMNWRTPTSTRYRTARRRNARLARATRGVSGQLAVTWAAISRSAAKLWLPPRNASYMRATFGRVTALSLLAQP